MEEQTVRTAFIFPFPDTIPTAIITPARKFRILAHTNPTRQRGECLRALAGASGSYVQGCETFLPG